MAENIEKQQKDKVMAFEGDIKTAFKENRYDAVRSLAKELNTLEPGNAVAAKLLEKLAKAEAEAKARQNAAKIREYENMLAKQYKDGNFENVKKLIQELKSIDPASKSALNWAKKTETAEAEWKRKQNEAKISSLQDQAKQAFADGKFADMDKYAQDVLKLDPENGYVKKLMVKAAYIKQQAAEKAAKEMAKTKVAAEKATVKKEVTPVKVTKPEEKKTGFFTKLFNKPEKEAAVVKQVQSAKTEEKKANIFSALAKKVDTSVQKTVAEVKPQVVSKPLITPQPVPQVAPKLTVQAAPQIAPKPVTAEVKKSMNEGKGNIFTKVFGEKVELENTDKSIIDTIVAKTAAKKAEAKMAKVEKKVEQKEEGLALATFGKVFLQFSVAFIVISAGFFYVQNIDKNNTVLGLVGIEDNYASQLHKAALTLEEKKTEEAGINKEIKRFQEGYNNQYEKTINSIMDKRLNWPDILTKINEVANFIFPRNEISQYIKFNNFSFNAESRTIKMSGSLTDPAGKNLTMLVVTEEAFKNYPGDPSDPENTEKPYFKDVNDFRTFSKTCDKKTGKCTSNFQLSLTLNEDEKAKTETETKTEISK